MCGIFALLSHTSSGNRAAADESHHSDARNCWCSDDDQDQLLSSLKSFIFPRGPDYQGWLETSLSSHVNFRALSTVLHCRYSDAGNSEEEAWQQPIWEKDRGIFLWNGEVFDGMDIALQEGDTRKVFDRLLSSEDILTEMDKIKGPFAFVFWKNSNKTLYFGRDRLGRRSLLRGRRRTGTKQKENENNEKEGEEGGGENNEEKKEEGVICLSSVSVGCCEEWIELNPGLYELKITDKETPFRWEDVCFRPWPSSIDHKCSFDESVTVDWEGFVSSVHVPRLIDLLQNGVRRRTTHVMARTGFESNLHPRIAILFSGGLDCMVLAALSHRTSPPHLPIDLFNVSFSPADSPDRLTAIEGWIELCRFAPERQFRLVAVDVTFGSSEEMISEIDRVKLLINPSDTNMDLSIAAALWFAALGKGTLYERSVAESVDLTHVTSSRNITAALGPGIADYESPAKVVLSGLGADELFGGYSRHRQKFRHGGGAAVAAELEMDVNRIWIRNLGRDDRVISDRGREARFPFLDEDVLNFVSDSLPLQMRCDLKLPAGVGDKKILRMAAASLGLQTASKQQKRAIQFGSRIAKVCNETLFPGEKASGTMKISGAASASSE